MAETDPPSALDPIQDRVHALDVVRGLALFGVLTVNLCTEFRVSLFDWLAHFDVGPTGPVSRAVAFARGPAARRTPAPRSRPPDADLGRGYPAGVRRMKTALRAFPPDSALNVSSPVCRLRETNRLPHCPACITPPRN